MSLIVADAVDCKGFPTKSRKPGIFVWEGLSCGTNIFIKTTPHIYIYIYTHTHFLLFYIHTYIYIHTFLFDKLYIYTHSKKKRFSIFNQNYV